MNLDDVIEWANKIKTQTREQDNPEDLTGDVIVATMVLLLEKDLENIVETNSADNSPKKLWDDCDRI